MPNRRHTSLDVTTLFDAYGARAYGESVTQLAHALQCAALAREDGADDEVVLAALLHDVGQFTASAADRKTLHHGHHGANLLRPFVPERVAWLVEYHVVAKRYLCTVDRRYAARLSAVSARTLVLQGSMLPVEERLALESQPWFVDAVRIRRWDDDAKVPGAVVPGLDEYRPLLERWLGPQSRGGP
jgi:predicted HD phosphohydrolase